MVDLPLSLWSYALAWQTLIYQSLISLWQGPPPTPTITCRYTQAHDNNFFYSEHH